MLAKSCSCLEEADPTTCCRAVKGARCYSLTALLCATSFALPSRQSSGARPCIYGSVTRGPWKTNSLLTSEGEKEKNTLRGQLCVVVQVLVNSCYMWACVVWFLLQEPILYSHPPPTQHHTPHAHARPHDHPHPLFSTFITCLATCFWVQCDWETICVINTITTLSLPFQNDGLPHVFV